MDRKTVFEFHGWAVVSCDTYQVDPERQAELEARLSTHLDALPRKELWSIRRENGQTSLLVSGLLNHHSGSVVDTFKWLAQQGPGSYGVLYVNDQEADEGANEFRVWRLARGRLEEHQDPFLSPRVAKIEDPYDAKREAQ